MPKIICTLMILFLPLSAYAQNASLRVVDVGPGLCVIATMPDGAHMLYDAGHWNGKDCLHAVDELVEDDVIELVVISHSDSDHLGELDLILEDHSAEVILSTGFERDTKTFGDAMRAMGSVVPAGASVLNLGTWNVPAGMDIQLGDGRVTILSGWHDWDETLSEGHLGDAELRNVVSIAVRLEYQGHSVLLAGDSVGREIGDDVSVCDHGEAWMVETHGTALQSDVLIASHHGADNGNATCFIEAVDPEFVIFSAGHVFEHPRQVTAERFLSAGVRPENMFRTDLGDDESPGSNQVEDEWSAGSITGCQDRRGDDHIQIVLPGDPAANVEVSYLVPPTGC